METIRTNAVIFACAVAASKDWKGLFSSSDGNMIFTYNVCVTGGKKRSFLASRARTC